MVRTAKRSFKISLTWYAFSWIAFAMLVWWGISDSLVAGRWYVSKRRKAKQSTRENAYMYKSHTS